MTIKRKKPIIHKNNYQGGSSGEMESNWILHTIQVKYLIKIGNQQSYQKVLIVLKQMPPLKF